MAREEPSEVELAVEERAGVEVPVEELAGEERAGLEFAAEERAGSSSRREGSHRGRPRRRILPGTPSPGRSSSPGTSPGCAKEEEEPS